MNLVIVESPAKAITLNKFLGKDYKVLASYGHIRDLPSKNGSVDPDDNFKMVWEVDSFSRKYLKEITDAAKDSSKIILATDPDREGEAIAWHVKEYLNEKKLVAIILGGPCHAIASPSRSGSVAKIILEESLAASVISFKYFLEKLSTSQSILKLSSGSTEPFFEGRSRIWP